MSGFGIMALSPPQVTEALDEAAQELRRQQRIHLSRPPLLSPGVAGRGFEDLGRRLQVSLEQLHEAGAAKLSATIDAVSHAQGEVVRAFTTDEEGAADLGRWQR